MKVLLWFLLLVCCSGQDPYEHEGQYNFSYQVEDGYSGNQFGHSENRLGSATAGAYHVLLPDGRVQTVEYTVDSYAGYKATVHYEGGSQEFRYDPIKEEYQPVKQAYEPAKLVLEPVKPVYRPVKPVYNIVKPVYKTESPIKKAEYSQINPVPFLVSPDYSKPAPEKTSFSNYKPPHQYQTAFSSLRPTYVPFQKILSPHHSSYNEIFDSPVPAPLFSSQTIKPTISYQPQSYKPAPVENHRPIHNLLVRPSPHHIVIKNPHPHPLAPPEHHKPLKNLKPDPFLVSEEELRGRDFSDPFWYPCERKIVKGYRKEEKEGHDLV